MAAFAMALLLAVGVYIAHVLKGGWYLDDWIDIALIRDAGSLAAGFGAMNDATYRPGLSLSLVGFYALAGDAPSSYLVIGVVLTAVQGALYYLVLRALRFSITVAIAAGAIFVVLPCIDATRLWMAAMPIQLAGALYLLGVLAALRGIEGGAAKRGMPIWHVLALVLFAAAMLTYELIAGVVLVTCILYVVRGAARGAALRRAAADWGCTAGILYLLAQRAVDDRGADTTLGHVADRARQMVDPAGEVFGSLLIWSGAFGGVVAWGLLGAGLVGVGTAIKQSTQPIASGLKRWLGVAGVGIIFAVAGLVMLLPADPYFVPRLSGLGNRTGAFAAFGAVVLLVAVIAITCGGIGALLRRPAGGMAVAAVVTAATLITLAIREGDQQNAWAQAWDEQLAVLSSINEALDQRVGVDTAVVTFGHTTFILPADVSVFAYSWDLHGALWNVFRVPSSVGHPWTSGSQCGPLGVVFPDGTGSPDGAAPYGYSANLVFIDARTASARRIKSRRSCERAVGVLAPAAPRLM